MTMMPGTLTAQLQMNPYIVDSNVPKTSTSLPSLKPPATSWGMQAVAWVDTNRTDRFLQCWNLQLLHDLWWLACSKQCDTQRQSWAPLAWPASQWLAAFSWLRHQNSTRQHCRPNLSDML